MREYVARITELWAGLLSQVQQTVLTGWNPSPYLCVCFVSQFNGQSSFNKSISWSAPVAIHSRCPRWVWCVSSNAQEAPIQTTIRQLCKHVKTCLLLKYGVLLSNYPNLLRLWPTLISKRGLNKTVYKQPNKSPFSTSNVLSFCKPLTCETVMSDLQEQKEQNRHLFLSCLHIFI